MNTLRDIIEAYGGGTRLAGFLGCSPTAISNWQKRGLIPRARWLDLIEVADANDIQGISLEVIRRAHRRAPAHVAA